MNDTQGAAQGRYTRIPYRAVDALPIVGTTAFAVFGVLASHANKENVCWPSVAKIADRAGIKERAAQLAINALVQEGLIVVEKHSGRVNRYRIVFVDERSAPACAPGAHVDAPGGAPACAPGAHVDAPTTRSLELDSNNKSQRTEREKTAPHPLLLFLTDEWNSRNLGPPVSRDPLPVTVLRSWNEMLNDRDGKSLVESETAIRALLDSVVRNDWATSQTSWGIDWLLKKNQAGVWKASKLLSGAYSNQPRPTQARPQLCGPGAVYDPEAKKKDSAYGTI